MADSRYLSTTVYLGLLLQLYVSCFGEKFTCPEGWIHFNYNKTASCLFVSNETIKGLSGFHEQCKEKSKNANFLAIQTNEKYEAFKEFVLSTLGNEKRVWIAATLHPYKEGLWWMGKNKYEDVASVIDEAGKGMSRCPNSGLTYKGGQLERTKCTFGDGPSAHYICEQRGRCRKGLYGENCEKECHCHAETCDPFARYVRCSYGCEVGWSGRDCGQKTKDANVNFFCVNSPDRGNFVQIRIDYNGLQHPVVKAFDKDGVYLPWCKDTTIEKNDAGTSETISIFVNNSNENCAGKVSPLDNGLYDWQISVQENEGLVGRHDQDFLIICDFPHSGSFSAGYKTKIKHEKIFSQSNVKRPILVLKEKKPKVDLVLADPRTGQPTHRPRLGQSVILKVRFRRDTLLTGVVPFNCHVSSPNNRTTKRLIGKLGCPMEGMPVSAFYKNSTTGVVTKPFRLFGLDGYKAAVFHCSYHLCFGDDPCPVGCQN